VVKSPNSAYLPGRRGKNWVKLKKELDTLDVVIVAAEYGHGKRAGVISDYTFAVRDGDDLKVIGKAYSGLTDPEILDMTEILKQITVKDYGYRRSVKPQVVLEVAFDAVQKSARHDSGYALRFPRIKRIRTDKSVAQIDGMEKVKQIYERQKVKF
ncbi:MAG: ATP-dependent DNA ligase, partial [Nitrososphaerales archaeon]